MATLYGNTTNHWRAYMTDSEPAATQMPNATITIAAGMQSVAWGFSISSGISCSIECTGQTATTATGQSFSAASGATTSKQMASRTFTIARTRATQTVTVKATVTNASGYANGTSTVSKTYTISPLSSHTVSYDANGGTGAPSAQTKWYGSVLTLSTTVPTRTNYTFKGWATSATGSVAYQPGGSYGADAAVTLYAVWAQAVKAPTVTNAHAYRCTSAGAEDNEGTYARVTLGYAADTSVVTANKIASVAVKYRAAGASSWASGTSATPSAATGTYLSAVIGGGALSVDSSYEVHATVTDSQGLVTSVLLGLGPSYYTMDILATGKGVAFGMACSEAGIHFNEPKYTFGDGSSALASLTGSQCVTVMTDETSWSKLAGQATTPVGNEGANGLFYRRNGRMVTVYINGGGMWGPSVTTSGTVIGTLPAGYRPDCMLCYPVAHKGTATQIRAEVYPDGQIKLVAQSGSTSYYAATLTFPSA